MAVDNSKWESTSFNGHIGYLSIVKETKACKSLMFGILIFFEIVRMEKEVKMIFNKEGIDIQDVDWINWMARVEKYWENSIIIVIQVNRILIASQFPITEYQKICCKKLHYFALDMYIMMKWQQKRLRNIVPEEKQVFQDNYINCTSKTF